MALQTISEKTGIGIGLLLSVGGLLVGGAITAATAVYRVGALEQAYREQKVEEKETHAKLEATAANAAKDAQAQDKRLTVVETNLTNITGSLGRIEGLLSSGGGVVTVKGHAR